MQDKIVSEIIDASRWTAKVKCEKDAKPESADQ